MILFLIFFFNDPATTELYTLSLHDALPICVRSSSKPTGGRPPRSPSRKGTSSPRSSGRKAHDRDRKSTRLNSSHLGISYAVFCLKKKKGARQLLPRIQYSPTSKTAVQVGDI